MSDSPEIDVDDLPEPMRLAATGGLMPKRERRRQLADDLYATLVDGHYTFWGHVHPLLLKRDITRHDLRQLLRRGLTTTRGNYRAMLKLFGMPESDYKRFMNFLAAHDCTVDFREFRTLPGEPGTPAQESARLPFEQLEFTRPRADRALDSLGRGSRGRTRSATVPGSFLDPILKNPRGAWVAPATNARAASSPPDRVGLRFGEPAQRAARPRALDDDTAIILAPCNSIHTFFMQFSIDVAFVARDGRHRPRSVGSVPAWRIRVGAARLRCRRARGRSADARGDANGKRQASAVRAAGRRRVRFSHT